MRIWKVAIEIVDLQTVITPASAQFLTAQSQGLRNASLWFVCDENAEPQERTIAMYGTGNPIPDDPGQYIATV